MNNMYQDPLEQLEDNHQMKGYNPDIFIPEDN
jgi:hypothetical protein